MLADAAEAQHTRARLAANPTYRDVLVSRDQRTAGLVPIVALTANPIPESHARILAAGLEGIMVKPLAIDGGLGAALQAARGRRDT